MRDPAAPDPRRWQALVLLCMAFFMVVLSSTSVFTAAPSIARDIRLSTAGAQWIFTAYALTGSGLLLLGGRIVDALGPWRVFMAGVGLFASTSVLCGFAGSGPVLIGARAIQGVAAATMVPAALSLVIRTFDDQAERNRALGVWSSLAGVGATAGLLLGGLATDVLGWRWVFFINVPIASAVLLLTPVVVNRGRGRGRAGIGDPAGALIITGALVLLVYAVTEAPDVGWATIRTIGILATSVALTALFAIVEHTASAPLLPLRILRVRAVAGGNLVLVGAGMAVDGMLFTVTLYTQRVLGYSAIRFGCTMAAMTATSVAGSYLAQRLVTRAGTRPVAAGGAALLGVSCVVLATLPVKGGLGILLSGLLVFGLGMGGAFVAGSIASLTGAGEQESGVAAGLQSTSFGVGTALGVALLSTVAVLSTPHLAATGQAAHLTVLADGYRAAFDAAVVVAALTVLAAVAFLSAAAPRATGRSARPVRRTGRHLHPHTPPVPGASSAMTNRNAATSSQREGQTP